MVQRVHSGPSATTRATGCSGSWRRSSGSMVTWRRAQMVLLSAQGMDAIGIAAVTFASPDRVRDVLHDLNADGFDSLRPRYAGGRPPKFDVAQRAQITQIALGRPADHGLPFSTWSLSKLADFLVAEGWSRTSPTRACACCSARRASPFRAVRTWKTSTDPDYEAKKNRLHGRVRAAEPPAPSGPAVGLDRGRHGRSGTAPATPPASHLPTSARDPPSAGLLRPGRRSAPRTHQGPQDPHRVPRLLPLPPHAAPGRGADRDRAGQPQPTPVDQDRPAGR